MVSATLLTLLSAATLATATISYNSTLTHSGDKESWFDGSIPAASISESCGKAYAQDLPCDERVLSIFDDHSSESENLSNDTLKARCTDTCLLGLQKWRDDIRKSCTDKDVGRKSTVRQQTISSLLDTKQMFVQYLYWSTCVKDLNNGTFCYAKDGHDMDSPASSNDSENTPEIIDAFCKNNCETQASVYIWAVGGSIYNDTQDINIADARKVCKGLDTSKYPFLKDLSAGGSSGSSGSGSSGSSGSGAGASANSTGGNGTGTGAKNDGVRVGGGIGLLASVALAAAVVVGLGSF